MKILLRTPDVVRRLTVRFDRFAPHWPHHTRLKALAVMLGYESWEELVGSCDSSAPLFVFDQDLQSDDERHARWLVMAQQVAKAFDLLLPDGIDLIRTVLPTSQINRNLSAWDDNHPAFIAALSKESDVWRVHVYYQAHPFAPPGFVYCKAYSVTDMASKRLARGRRFHEPLYPASISILMPESFHRERVGVNVNFRRGEVLEVEPVPFGYALQFPNKCKDQLAEFFSIEYPALPENDRIEHLSNWRTALSALFIKAGLPANSKRRDVQMTIGSRWAMGQNWYWPFVLKNSSDLLIGQMHDYAVSIDLSLRRRDGSDRGYIRWEG